MTGYRTVWLALTAPAATSWDTSGAPHAQFQALADARVVRVYLQLPPGSRGLLRVAPRILSQTDEVQQILTYAQGGDGYLRGDFVAPTLECDVRIRTGEWLQAWYDNTDDAIPHWFALGVTLTGGL